MGVQAALRRTFLGRRVRDLLSKHYERVSQFGFKALQKDRYYAPTDLDAAFDALLTSPTVTTPRVVDAHSAPQREGRTFKWKGLPPLDESDLHDVPNEEAVPSDMERAIEHLSASCMKVSAAVKAADLSDEQAVALIEALVGGALQLAALTGHVLTVETRPKAELAMGVYNTVVNVRESNKVYRERYRLEAEAKEAAAQSDTGPVVLGHPLTARARQSDYSPKTLELARRVLEARDNDTRTEEQKIADASAFICDTRLDRRPTQVIAGDFGTYEHPYLTSQVDYHPV
jgi:hypothetical protein